MRLARDHDSVHVGDLRDEVPGLYASQIIVGEVAPNAGAQPLRLADVQDAPVLALPEIHSWRFGKVGELDGN